MKLRHPSGDESLLSAADTVSMYMWYIVIKSDQIFCTPCMHCCVDFPKLGIDKNQSEIETMVWGRPVKLDDRTSE